MSNFMKIRPVGAQFFHAYGWKNMKTNSRFFQFCESN